MRSGLLIGAGLAALAYVAGLATSTLGSGPGVQAEPGARWAPVSTLAARPAAIAPSASTPAPKTAPDLGELDDGVEALEARLNEVRDGMDLLHAQLGGSIELLRRSLERPNLSRRISPRDALRSKPRMDTWALREFADLWAHNPALARGEVLFLEPAQALERFGPPTRVSGERDGRVRWTWGPPSDEGPRVSLTLLDRLVVEVSVFTPAP